MLKKFYISVNRNMRFIIVGFISAVFAGSALLPADFYADNLLPAWGLVTVFALFMAAGDKLWWDDVKALFK